jgi:solute carrier family 45 protein 1/2/4
LTLAYCKQLATFLVDLFGGGQGDWDPKRADYISNTAIGLAVVSFYLLDFALNALQASLRNLLLDITPADQLNVGNAWHSRMTQAGNIIGYGFGFFPLEDIPVLEVDRRVAVQEVLYYRPCGFGHHGLDHMLDPGGTRSGRRNRLKAGGWLLVCLRHWYTGLLMSAKQPYEAILGNIRAAILKLPLPIKKVCAVQLFAFMGW